MKANYAAWQIPTVVFNELTPREKLVHILRYAVIAPSAHNTQPWRFRITPEHNTIEILLERQRLLGSSDPTNRQTFLGLGATIENICTAVTAYQGSTDVTYLPADEKVATIKIQWGASSAPVDTASLTAMEQRHTNRADYKDEVLSSDIFSSFTPRKNVTVQFVDAKDKREKIGELVAQADLALMDRGFKEELSHWVRHNWTKESTGMPGGVQGIPAPLTLIVKWVVTHAPIEKDQAKKDARQISNSPLVAVVLGKDDTKLTWLEAGRTLERLFLRTAAEGLSSAPFGSVIQHEEGRRGLQSLLNTTDTPLALVRIGHTQKPMPRTPRLQVEEVLID